MVHRVVNDVSVISDVIRKTFEADDDLFSDFHIVENDKEKAIKDTIEKNIISLSLSPAAVFYVLKNQNNEVIGFINIIPDSSMLYSFGLELKERTDENKKKLVNIIESLLPNGIICGLNGRNKRAIRFFEKNGFNKEEIVIMKKIK